MEVYFDNAATTPMDPEVLEAMKPYMTEFYGNPSSIHSFGRKSRSAIEIARKTIADLLNTSPSEIFFTSGGTEADNTALVCSTSLGKFKQVISSPLEHHAVLHTLENLAKAGSIELKILKVDGKGQIDHQQLEDLLSEGTLSLVSLMEANNEIGNLNDLVAIGDLCAEYDAVLHSDTVQSVGHYRHDLQELSLHCMVGSAHKFHGPKGAGFLYLNASHPIGPLIHGGAQERNMRGGTENVYGIVGLAKALEIAYSNMEAHRKHVEGLKSQMMEMLQARIPGVAFNGLSGDLSQSLYTILNVSLPSSADNDMLLFNLDISKIAASGGSACSSGSQIGSHVLAALGGDPTRGAVRFSFCKYNTKEEVDYVVEKLATLYTVEA